MTAIEHLRSVGVTEDQARRAVAAIAAVLPVDSIVRITEEVLEAVRAGNMALVSLLLAQEVDPDVEDFAALDAADRDNDGTRFTEAEVRARLGL